MGGFQAGDITLLKAGKLHAGKFAGLCGGCQTGDDHAEVVARATLAGARGPERGWAPLPARFGTPIRMVIFRGADGELLHVAAVDAGCVDSGLWTAEGEDDPRAVRGESDVEGAP